MSKLFRLLILGILFIFPCMLSAQEIDLLILNRDYRGAIELIDKGISTKPTAELYHKKGIVYARLIEYEKALESLETAFRLAPSSVAILEELAGMCNTMGNYNGAVLYYKRAALLSPDDIYLKGKIAHCYISLRDFREAYALYTIICKQDSTNNFYKKYYAFSAYQVDSLELAVSLYEELVVRRYPDLNVYLNLATIYAKIEEVEKAIQACVAGFYHFPEHPSLLLKHAEISFQSRDYKKAQLIYESYLAKNKPSLMAMKNYGICLCLNGKEEKSIEVFQRCISEGLADPMVFYYLGISYKKLKKIPESIESLNRAISFSIPSFIDDFYHHLGLAYSLNNEFGKAIECFNKALEFEPTNFELLFEIARVHDKQTTNKNQAMNFYQIYLKEAGEGAKNAEYALDRLKKLKEELFISGTL